MLDRTCEHWQVGGSAGSCCKSRCVQRCWWPQFVSNIVLFALARLYCNHLSKSEPEVFCSKATRKDSVVLGVSTVTVLRAVEPYISIRTASKFWGDQIAGKITRQLSAQLLHLTCATESRAFLLDPVE